MAEKLKKQLNGKSNGEEKTLELIMQSSEAYSAYAGVALTSYLENNKDIKEIIVYFISDNLSLKSKEKFIAATKQYGRKIQFFDADKIVYNLKVKGFRELHGSYTTYCKIFLLEEINFKTDKALYVDADTLCVESIKDILDVELGENNVCGMAGNLEPYVHKVFKAPNDMNWYNGGVILFNIKKWKEEHCSTMIYSYIAECAPNVVFAEQDISYGKKDS